MTNAGIRLEVGTKHIRLLLGDWIETGQPTLSVINEDFVAMIHTVRKDGEEAELSIFPRKDAKTSSEIVQRRLQMYRDTNDNLPLPWQKIKEAT